MCNGSAAIPDPEDTRELMPSITDNFMMYMKQALDNYDEGAVEKIANQQRDRSLTNIKTLQQNIEDQQRMLAKLIDEMEKY